MQKRRQKSIYEPIYTTNFYCCSICSDSLKVGMALRPASGSNTKAAMGGGQSFEKAAEKIDTRLLPLPLLEFYRLPLNNTKFTYSINMINPTVLSGSPFNMSHGDRDLNPSQWSRHALRKGQKEKGVKLRSPDCRRGGRL